MLRFIARRLVALVPVIVILSVAVFLMIHLTPGDPVRLMLGDSATQQSIAALRQALGLDQPLPVQYLHWASQAVRGNLGRSIVTNEPVTQAILTRLPVTLELSVLAMLVALVIGLPTGVVAALRRNSWLDYGSTTLALSGISLPSFFLGILLILVLSLRFRALPPGGYVPFVTNPVQNLKLMIMPSLALGAALAGIISRMMRSSLLEVLDADYVRTARSKGLRETQIVVRHAIRNALLPVVTIVGLQTGTLLGGAILTETIFTLPGVGRLIVDSIFARDFPMVQGVVLFLALVRVLSNLATDVVYGFVDPRISYSS